MNKTYSIAIAGSTQNTLLCAQAVFDHPDFTVSLVLTPAPKPVGRTQEITPNPLHRFAQEKQIPIVLIADKIDAAVQTQLEPIDRPDFLLVVDFGYIVPEWLLQWPTIAPLNIHPSKLPSWRGSSPGQFVLLYGEKNSAVSLIIMNDKLDQGAVVSQLPFTISESWTQPDYYQHSFALISQKLPELLVDLAEKKLTPTPQDELSQTPIAGRFEKQDGFLAWELLEQAQHGESPNSEQLEQANLSPILQAALTHHGSLAKMLFHASYAFQPWPGLWTVVQTKNGQKRMKILETKLEHDKLQLERVQIEGKQPVRWENLKKNYAS